MFLKRWLFEKIKNTDKTLTKVNEKGKRPKLLTSKIKSDVAVCSADVKGCEIAL